MKKFFIIFLSLIISSVTGYYILTDEPISDSLERAFEYDLVGNIMDGISLYSADKIIGDLPLGSAAILRDYLHEVEPQREDPSYRESQEFNRLRSNKIKIITGNIRLASRAGCDRLLEMGASPTLLLSAYLRTISESEFPNSQEYKDMLRYLATLYILRDDLSDELIIYNAYFNKDIVLLDTLFKKGVSRDKRLEYSMVSDDNVDLIRYFITKPLSMHYLENMLILASKKNQIRCFIAIINAWPYGHMPFHELNSYLLEPVIMSLQAHWYNYAHYLGGAESIRDDLIPEGYINEPNTYDFEFVKRYDLRSN